MYRTATLNPDGRPLEADHTTPRSQGGRRADRLLLAVCNRSRGDGTHGTRYAAPWHTRDWFTTGLDLDGLGGGE
jgi:5-methylcytosine-specific restriction endonuclease McrA